jgi:hypothetical protein
MESLSILERAAKSNSKPSGADVVKALLEAEKTAKRNKTNYSLEQLFGTWRLCFVTGTKKIRSKAGIALGAGRYVPGFIKIQISYSDELLFPPKESIEAGKVENTVELGGLKLLVSGPIKFLSPKNILVFDFTRTNLQLFGKTLYHNRGASSKEEEEFYQKNIGKQAFFTYFLVEKDFIAARGKGGGLALWSEQHNGIKRI